MVCHCGVLDGLPQPEAKILDPAIPLCPAKAMTPPKRRQLALQALAGAETVSYLAGQHAVTYCYLLSLEDHRDADTWGVRLLEAQHQGFQPEATIADAGQGIRAGIRLGPVFGANLPFLFLGLFSLKCHIDAFVENNWMTVLQGGDHG